MDQQNTYQAGDAGRGRGERRHARGGGTQIVVGLFIAAIGTSMLLNQRGIDVPPLWTLWPLLLIGLGLTGILTRRGPNRWVAGWLLIVGAFGAVSEWRLFGFSWETSWPVMVIAIGALLTLRGLFGPPWDCGGRRRGTVRVTKDVDTIST